MDFVFVFAVSIVSMTAWSYWMARLDGLDVKVVRSHVLGWGVAFALYAALSYWWMVV